MGVSFFQTAPRDHYVRWAIFFNTVALILLILGFAYSFNDDREISGVRLSTNYFENKDFARVSATKIFVDSDIVCPKSEANRPSFNATAATWDECTRFTDTAKVSLALDGCTIGILVILYCAQRFATTQVSDERRLLGIYFGLQLVPLSFHIIARLIFEGSAVMSAIAFLKASGINGGVASLSDEDVGIHYSAVQSLHASVAALMTGALAFISLKFFQITLRARIDSVELVRECAARSRGDKPDQAHAPMRWMLDPRYHPLFDFDQLETVRQKLIDGPSETETAQELAQLRKKLEIADQQWKEQQDELLREEEAYTEYSHRIRREERVENRVVVDDWERQQIVWQQRKAEVGKQFEEMGYCMPVSSSSETGDDQSVEGGKKGKNINNNNDGDEDKNMFNRRDEKQQNPPSAETTNDTGVDGQKQRKAE